MIGSPCVGLCALDSDDLCVGCHRHIAEITAWTQLSEPEKQAVIGMLEGRRLHKPAKESLRIASLLPAATEMVCALGLADNLVARTDQCDYPAEVRDKPIVVRNRLALQNLTPRQIDDLVTHNARNATSSYLLDEGLLQRLAPNLILAQQLCQVCAPAGEQVSELARRLKSNPHVVWLSPSSIAEMDQNLRDIGRVSGRFSQANSLINHGRHRLESIRLQLDQCVKQRPRVFCLEWVDPIYASGHWVPEMVELAGGHDRLSFHHSKSQRIDWAEVRRWAPEVLIINLCGYNVDEATAQASTLRACVGWADIPAVKQNRVFVVDANAYFARPGPRLIDGVELLAHLFHPESFPWNGPLGAWRRFR